LVAPGNRFWPALQRAGLTPRLFTPREERELLNAPGSVLPTS